MCLFFFSNSKRKVFTISRLESFGYSERRGHFFSIIGNFNFFIRREISNSLTNINGRMIIPLCTTSFGDIVSKRALKNKFKSNVSIKSFLWCPRATLLYQNFSANLNKKPLLSLLHKEQGILFLGYIFSRTMSKILVS